MPASASRAFCSRVAISSATFMASPSPFSSRFSSWICPSRSATGFSKSRNVRIEVPGRRAGEAAAEFAAVTGGALWPSQGEQSAALRVGERMVLVDELLQALVEYVRINLRRGDVGMAE